MNVTKFLWIHCVNVLVFSTLIAITVWFDVVWLELAMLGVLVLGMAGLDVQMMGVAVSSTAVLCIVALSYMTSAMLADHAWMAVRALFSVPVVHLMWSLRASIKRSVWIPLRFVVYDLWKAKIFPPVTATRTRRERSSLVLNKFLDSGYSVEERKARQAFYKSFGLCFAELYEKSHDYYSYIAGSKGEGIALVPESDTDFVLVKRLTRDDRGNVGISVDGEDVKWVQFVQEGAPFGYVYLRLSCKVSNAGQKRYYSHRQISMEYFINKWKDTGIFNWGKVTVNEPQGPSRPLSVCIQFHNLMFRAFHEICPCPITYTLQLDTVFVLEYPLHNGTWGSRDRSHNWPSRDMIDHVMSLPVHLAPVGQKGHSRNDTQWRLSFTLAETYLVQQFSDVQAKVYICLKKYCKSYLKPVSDNMSSYVIKNVMFWYCERCPRTDFQSHTLLDRVDGALEILYDSIKNGNLPHYFVPERNLFEERLDRDSKAELIKTMDEQDTDKLIAVFDDLDEDVNSYIGRVFDYFLTFARGVQWPERDVFRRRPSWMIVFGIMVYWNIITLIIKVVWTGVQTVFFITVETVYR